MGIEITVKGARSDGTDDTWNHPDYEAAIRDLKFILRAQEFYGYDTVVVKFNKEDVNNED